MIENRPTDGDGSELRSGLPFGVPLLDVRPVPCGTATNRPFRLRQDVPVAPHVHCGPFYTKPCGYLGDAYRVAISHERSVAKVLTPDQHCSDNQYMTQTENTTKTAACGCSFTGRIYSLRNCTVIDTATATGTQQMRHAMVVERKAK